MSAVAEGFQVTCVCLTSPLDAGDPSLRRLSRGGQMAGTTMRLANA